MKNKRVILLSGHNFVSSGCHTVIGGKIITEFDMVTEIVARVFKKERLMGIDLVNKARNQFGDLVEEVNSLNGQYLISCHLNAYNQKTQGTEVLYSSISSRSKVLATMAQRKLVKHLGLNDRGIKETGFEDRGGSILNKTKPVAILIEPFFLDEIKDKETLNDYMDKTVHAILEILDYIDKREI